MPDMPVRDVPEKFQVAFSFAGEQRDLVRSIAKAVETRLGLSTVFFDEWYEAYIAGDSADIVLLGIYCERCDVAVVVSPNATVVSRGRLPSMPPSVSV
jgi:hypothetical protein